MALQFSAVTILSTKKRQFKVKGDQRLDQIKEAPIKLRAGVIKVPQTTRKISRPMLHISDGRLQAKLFTQKYEILNFFLQTMTKQLKKKIF